MSPDLIVMINWASYPGMDPKSLADVARRAEDAGVTGLAFGDHVVMGTQTDLYPGGPMVAADDADWPEPLMMLTWVAAATSMLRLCTGVLIVPLRPAILLAKTAATLDVLSGGRLELGVGAGWQREEFMAEGLEFADRGPMLTDTMRACKTLWKSGGGSFESPSVSFSQISCRPLPVQPGGPPLLFGGKLTKQNIRRIVELADGWIPFLHDTEIAEGVALLKSELERAGRPAANFRVRPYLPVVTRHEQVDLPATLSSMDEQAEALGATEFTLRLGQIAPDEAAVKRFFSDVKRALT